MHETGHALGIGWPDPTEVTDLDKFFNLHPENRTGSIMSYNASHNYCSPQRYDIIAIKANYQSR